MAGDIYIGFDSSNPEKIVRNDGYVNSRTFMAFGDFLEEALRGGYAKILDEIKNSEPMAIYDLTELSASEFNLVVSVMRQHIAGLKNPSDWQQVGAWAWHEIAEPAVLKDERYDLTFHEVSSSEKRNS